MIKENVQKKTPKQIDTSRRHTTTYVSTYRHSSKLGEEYNKFVYCHPAYLTYMQSTSYEMPGRMNHKLESKFLGELSITDMQMTPP